MAERKMLVCPVAFAILERHADTERWRGSTAQQRNVVCLFDGGQCPSPATKSTSSQRSRAMVASIAGLKAAIEGGVAADEAQVRALSLQSSQTVHLQLPAS